MSMSVLGQSLPEMALQAQAAKVSRSAVRQRTADIDRSREYPYDTV